MAKKSRPKESRPKRRRLPDYEKYPNLPTQERLQHGGMVIRNQRGVVKEALRIDKLLLGGVIDEMQHCYGVQLITLWTIALRPNFPTMRFEARTGNGFDPHWVNVHRLHAEDQLTKTLSQLPERAYRLITLICFEEKGAIEAGRSLRLPVNSITVYIREAFDLLGDALAVMRKRREK